MASSEEDAERTVPDTVGSGVGLREGALLIVTGDGQLSTYSLDAGEVVIGRADDCDIVVPHPSLSRRHARLRLGPPLQIQDLGSTNGTRVARKKLHGGEPAPLEPGESFRIGKLSFMVVRKSVHASAASAAELEVLDPTHPSPLVGEIAKSGVNLLVLGETGVGKEVLAETVHRLSARSGPLQRLNCSALAPSLVESELFGHVKGAFTGATESRAGLLESAAGGTLFLDEIGELPEAVQAKLLRAIESKEVLRLGSTRPTRVDVRFISATHRDLASEIARGRFRADLFYRLDGLTLTIPPLRRRRDQIGRLALQFLREAHERHHGKKPQQVSPELLRQLQSYDWPGNVRELKAVVERAVLLARGGEVGPSHVRVSPMAPSAPAPPPTDGDAGEKQRILDALEACAGNQTRAAQKLGMARSTLAVKLTLYRIPRPRK